MDLGEFGQLEAAWKSAKPVSRFLLMEQHRSLHDLNTEEWEKKFSEFEAAVPADFLLASVVAQVQGLKRDGQAYCRCVEELRAKGIPSQQDDRARRRLLSEMEDRFDAIYDALGTALFERLPLLVESWFTSREKLFAATATRHDLPAGDHAMPQELEEFQDSPDILYPTLSSMRAVFPFEHWPVDPNNVRSPDNAVISATRDRAENFHFEKLTQDVKAYVLFQLDVPTLATLPLVSTSFQALSEVVLERKMFAHFSERVMLDEWRLLCRARVAELQLLRSYEKVHNLQKVLDASIRESSQLRSDVENQLDLLEGQTSFLKGIQHSWVMKLLDELAKVKRNLAEVRKEVKSALPAGEHVKSLQRVDDILNSFVERVHPWCPKERVALQRGRYDGSGSPPTFNDDWKVNLGQHVEYLNGWSAHANEIFATSKPVLEQVLEYNDKLRDICQIYVRMVDDSVSCRSIWKRLIDVVHDIFNHLVETKSILQDTIGSFSVPERSLVQQESILTQLAQISALESQLNEQSYECTQAVCKERILLHQQISGLQKEIIDRLLGQNSKSTAWNDIKSNLSAIENSFPSPDWTDPRAGFHASDRYRRLRHDVITGRLRRWDPNGFNFLQLRNQMDLSAQYLFKPAGARDGFQEFMDELVSHPRQQRLVDLDD